jgi:hypothetical protein
VDRSPSESCKLDLLDIACHRCERRGRFSLSRLIEEHGADTGLPDLWESVAGDCQHARSTALNNRCAIYYPQIAGAVPAGQGNLTPVNWLRCTECLVPNRRLRPQLTKNRVVTQFEITLKGVAQP